MGVEVFVMNNKDKSIYTLTVPCNGERHQISLTKKGKLKLLNHTDTDVEAELALEKLGGELPECIKIQKAWKNNAWKNNAYWFEQCDNDSVLDDALTYFDFAYDYRNSLKEKVLSLFGIFISSFIISTIISLIQQRFDLFWIYTFASVNVVFGLYYVFLSIEQDITLSPTILGELLLVLIETRYFSVFSLQVFKIFNVILLLIFMLLYLVPIIGNKILLELENEIEKD